MGTSSPRADQYVPRRQAWRDAKAPVTSFTRGTGASVESAVRAFVRAIGGSRRASRGGLSSSVRSGQALGAFLAGVASVGLDETLRSAGLEYLVGRTPHEVLAGIADHIGGDGGLLDDAVARSAVVDVLADIFDETEDSYDQLRDRWDSQLDKDTIIELMVLFLAQSIFQRFLADLGDRIESNAVSTIRAAECEQEVLEFIKRMIEFELGEIDPLTFDWQGSPGEQLIRRNLEAALAQVEE